VIIMSNLQKKMAAQVLKVGKNRVWLDPKQAKDLDAAITKADVRKMILKGWIKALPEKIHRPKEKKKRGRGRGSRKGARYSIINRKRRWISRVRPMREMLKEMREKKQIDNPTFKKVYSLVKGGMFRSRSHLRLYMEQNNLLKKGES
jgi:large subunit ribosomal protein L19e